MPNSPSPPRGMICNLSEAMNLQFSAVVRAECLDGAKDTRWQEKEGGDKFKDAVDDDAD
jgi:hypothetical protein